jgi:hypothetical protein
MAFLGTYQLGDLVSLSMWTRDTAQTPVEPASAPRALVRTSSGSQVVSQLIPVEDSARITGLFQYKVSLDGKFATGHYTIQYLASVGGVDVSEQDEFEIVAGGDGRGRGLAMSFFKPATNEFVLVQTDSGVIKRFKNPSVS